MALPMAAPADPTNTLGDVPAAAALGERLFHDASLSPTGRFSCATCHDPARDFQDGLPVSVAAGRGQRNTPSILAAAHARWQLWDGRADSLWMQALGPLEDPAEMASSRLFVAHRLYASYGRELAALGVTLPPLGDGARFPPAGKPGDDAWAAMAPADRAAVDALFATAGKLVAAFERTLRVGPGPLDAYVAGARDALTAAQKHGLHAFFSAGCIQCHHGPRLTDDAFHNVRFPGAGGAPDEGRAAGVPRLLASEFRGDGPHSDDPVAGAARLAGLLAAGRTLPGRFRTPSLRGAARTGPYGHGGGLATLEDVMKVYARAGLPRDDPRALGDAEPWVVELDTGGPGRAPPRAHRDAGAVTGGSATSREPRAPRRRTPSAEEGCAGTSQ
jgi:cytochrome c peroxidase